MENLEGNQLYAGCKVGCSHFPSTGGRDRSLACFLSKSGQIETCLYAREVRHTNHHVELDWIWKNFFFFWKNFWLHKHTHVAYTPHLGLELILSELPPFMLRTSACLDLLLSISILGNLAINELMKSRGTRKLASKWSKQRLRNRGSHLKKEGYSPGMPRVCPNPFRRTVPGNDQDHQYEVNNFTLPEAAGHISTNHCRIFLTIGAERAAVPHAKPGPDPCLTLCAKNSSQCTRHPKHRS